MKTLVQSFFSKIFVFIHYLFFSFVPAWMPGRRAQMDESWFGYTWSVSSSRTCCIVTWKFIHIGFSLVIFGLSTFNMIAPIILDVVSTIDTIAIDDVQLYNFDYHLRMAKWINNIKTKTSCCNNILIYDSICLYKYDGRAHWKMYMSLSI